MSHVSLQSIIAHAECLSLLFCFVRVLSSLLCILTKKKKRALGG
jgi:hypothetical protein